MTYSPVVLTPPFLLDRGRSPVTTVKLKSDLPIRVDVPRDLFLSISKGVLGGRNTTTCALDLCPICLTIFAMDVLSL